MVRESTSPPTSTVAPISATTVTGAGEGPDVAPREPPARAMTERVAGIPGEGQTDALVRNMELSNRWAIPRPRPEDPVAPSGEPVPLPGCTGALRRGMQPPGC